MQLVSNKTSDPSVKEKASIKPGTRGIRLSKIMIFVSLLKSFEFFVDRLTSISLVKTDHLEAVFVQSVCNYSI